MARALRHRGPDGFGIALGPDAGFVSTRLAIVDIPGGWQPLTTDTGSLLVYNGEVYNAPELGSALSREGVRFRTRCDTEVVLHMLERRGVDSLPQLNGQFAFAWWQPHLRRLTLARDRFGVRPVYYACDPDGSLVFASEAKALFASGEVEAAPDLAGLDDVFTLWGARAPVTPFRGVLQVPAGGVVVWCDGRIVEQRRWWQPDYDAAGPEVDDREELAELLHDSVRLRLRADVPVGMYLSGGVDSSLITAIAARESGRTLRTFSVAFRNPQLDESGFQRQVAAALGTEHHVVEIGPQEIACAFRDVVLHAETPLVRTAPVPLYLLARATRDHGITVVGTGEGADELFWGYDLFKELVIRRAALEDPAALAELDELYPYLAAPGARRGPQWRRFFAEVGSADDLLASHQTRAAATETVRLLYDPGVSAAVTARCSLDRLRTALPGGFERWSALERAAYLEVTTLLEPNLLAAQGDRVAMAHGVEARYPFLDHRVFALSTRLPVHRKLDRRRDKVALRDLAGRMLPPEIAERPKHPYRAPEVAPFFAENGTSPAWVEDALTPRALGDVGLFDPGRVAGLVRRCREGRATGPREGMALVAVLSTQIWFATFCGSDRFRHPPETDEPRLRIDLGAAATEDVA